MGVTDFAGAYATFHAFVVAIARLVPIFLMVPVFSGRVFTGLVRNGFIAVLGLLVVPSIDIHVLEALPPLAWFGLALKEVLIGVLLGFVFSTVLWACENVGHLIDFQTGSANAAFFDPVSGHPGGPTSSFLSYLAITLFVSIGGLQAMLGIIFESYRVWPAVSFYPNMHAALDEFTIRQMTLLMTWTIKLATPVIMVLFLAEIGIGLISRSVPQLNVFMFSQPIKSALALLMMILFLYFVFDSLRGFLLPGGGVLDLLRSLLSTHG